MGLSANISAVRGGGGVTGGKRGAYSQRQQLSKCHAAERRAAAPSRASLKSSLKDCRSSIPGDPYSSEVLSCVRKPTDCVMNGWARSATCCACYAV